MSTKLDQNSPETITTRKFELDSQFEAFALNDSTREQEAGLEVNLFALELDRDPILEISEVQGSEGIFNVAVLDVEGVKYLFGRKVQKAAINGEPDAGSLVMAELGPSRDIILTTEVWSPEDQDVLVEDPRAQQASNGRTIIGVTAVRKNDNYKTYPAIIELKSAGQLLTQPFPELRIIDRFGGGDQTTPIGEVVEGKNATTIDEKHIMYRPDGMNHTLQVLEYNDGDVSHVGFIEFPEDIPGASYKIGTTTPPEWLNENEAFFVIHGLDKTIDGKLVDPDTIDSRIVYQYSILSARLLRKIDKSGKVSFSVDNISKKPIITPDTFPGLGDNREIELHPDIRRVTYSCGGISHRESGGKLIKEELFVNQGDKRTWVAVIAADEIIAGWKR